MNTCRAVSFALLGWYLMLPPIPGGKLDVTAPLSRWEIQNAYDTQTDCQSNLSQIATEALAELQKPMPDEKAQLVMRNTSGQCIASDDSRLKEQ